MQDEGMLALQHSEIISLLAEYKVFQKQVVRDVSLANEGELGQHIRAIERWVIDVNASAARGLAEATVNSQTATSGENDAGFQMLIDALLEVGHLVPMSKKKRLAANKLSGRHASLQLPEEILAIWQPLLVQLGSSFPGWITNLIWELLELISDGASEGTDGAPADPSKFIDKSFLTTCTAWIVFLLNKEHSGLHDEVIRYCLININA